MDDLKEMKIRLARLRSDMDRLDGTRDQVSRVITDLTEKIRAAEVKRLRPRGLIKMEIVEV